MSEATNTYFFLIQLKPVIQPHLLRRNSRNLLGPLPFTSRGSAHHVPLISQGGTHIGWNAETQSCVTWDGAAVESLPPVFVEIATVQDRILLKRRCVGCDFEDEWTVSTAAHGNENKTHHLVPSCDSTCQCYHTGNAKCQPAPNWCQDAYEHLPAVHYRNAPLLHYPPSPERNTHWENSLEVNSSVQQGSTLCSHNKDMERGRRGCPSVPLELHHNSLLLILKGQPNGTLIDHLTEIDGGFLFVLYKCQYDQPSPSTNESSVPGDCLYCINNRYMCFTSVILGSGGNGAVFLGFDLKEGRFIAMKKQSTGGLATEATLMSRGNFTCVACVWAYFRGQKADKSKYVRPLSDSGLTNRARSIKSPHHDWLIIEFLPGGTLRRAVKTLFRKGLPDTSVRRICFELIKTLAELHSRGIVHRDLKCANVMLTCSPLQILMTENSPASWSSVAHGSMTRPIIKLIDFGNGALLQTLPTTSDQRIPSEQSQLLTGNLTTCFATAPEIIDCIEGRVGCYDHLVDIWAAGTILFEMLCGRRLFDVCSLSDMTPAIRKFHPENFQKHPALRGRDHRVVDLLSKMLCRSPRHRVTAMAALQHEFFNPLSPPLYQTSPDHTFARRLSTTSTTASSVGRIFDDSMSVNYVVPSATSGTSNNYDSQNQFEVPKRSSNCLVNESMAPHDSLDTHMMPALPATSSSRAISPLQITSLSCKKGILHSRRIWERPINCRNYGVSAESANCRCGCPVQAEAHDSKEDLELHYHPHRDFGSSITSDTSTTQFGHGNFAECRRGRQLKTASMYGTKICLDDNTKRESQRYLRIGVDSQNRSRQTVDCHCVCSRTAQRCRNTLPPVRQSTDVAGTNGHGCCSEDWTMARQRRTCFPNMFEAFLSRS